MPLFRSKAEDKVREAGFDPARLPPGQYFTEKWPVLHAGDVPNVDLATWTLQLSGDVEEPVTLTYDELRALPATEVTTDIHCVTRWSRFDAAFTGVHWRELAKLCRPRPTASFAIAHAEQGFTANVPLVIPSKYFWKSAKWLTGIELSSVDKPGFWERYGYHNDADFWKEQRYGF
jgi:DMSO/TMAO reductase YedYZ molybdopterin-dependent catalytic subunit